MPAIKKLTYQQKEKIRSLWLQDKGSLEISKIIGCSQAAVTRLMPMSLRVRMRKSQQKNLNKISIPGDSSSNR